MRLWLLNARDKPNALELRKATRDAHRAYIYRKDLPAEMVFGSPLLDEGGEMCGTWLVLMAAEKSDVEAFSAGDPYVHAGLFQSIEILEVHPTFDWEPKVENLRKQLDDSA